MFAGVCVHRNASGEPPQGLDLLACEYSPRVETVDAALVVFDASGLERLFGGTRALAGHVEMSAAARGWTCGIAFASTRTAAMLLARARPDVFVVPLGREAVWLAPLPIALLAEADTRASPDEQRRGTRDEGRERPAPAAQLLEAFARWGVHTLGDLAALPAGGLRTRLGPVAIHWQRLARGEDVRPLVRDPAEERFEERLSLDWPIEGLEPLSFVLARLLDPLCQHLERRDRGAVGLRLWLKLVTRTVFTRYLHLPVPMRDPKVLRTLLTLDLESHPPSAGIDEITLACDVAPGRILQHSLLTRPLPSPDRVSTLVARLTALMGEGRCGHPDVLDTHRPGGFEMRAFAPEAPESRQRSPVQEGQRSPVRVAGDGEAYRRQGQPAAALRRFRRPVVAQVVVQDERPVRVSAAGAGVRGGPVRQRAGPWRTSGCWWEPAGPSRERGAWDRDEWDVALDDRVVYRICRHRATGTWVVEGYWD